MDELLGRGGGTAPDNGGTAPLPGVIPAAASVPAPAPSAGPVILSDGQGRVVRPAADSVAAMQELTVVVDKLKESGNGIPNKKYGHYLNVIINKMREWPYAGTISLFFGRFFSNLYKKTSHAGQTPVFIIPPHIRTSFIGRATDYNSRTSKQKLSMPKCHQEMQKMFASDEHLHSAGGDCQIFLYQAA